jgi:small nuclear ribonucleoprotein (snRNP)-like protein
MMLIGILGFSWRLMLEPSRKPLNVLVKQLNSYVSIVLKNGIEYRGRMVKCDGHMNVLLEGATEFLRDRPAATYGSILLRGNNVLFICLDAVPTTK